MPWVYRSDYKRKFSGDLESAARIWAAAAGAAGAYAPRHIRDALLEGYSLCGAAIEGTRRAAEETEAGEPAPRGCDLWVNPGLVTLAWITEGHQILLSFDSSSARWVVEMDCFYDLCSTPGACRRVMAAMGEDEHAARPGDEASRITLERVVYGPPLDRNRAE